MQTHASNRPALRVRNFVISGTNYWNPGDDFVRDGIIHVLHALFPGEQLNFHFYNFNEDQFPKSKFKGLGNEISAGDLELCRDFIDGVIIAGLSAGHEIKDLYRWVIANGLEDRVYLIGAGYENPYCADNMVHEPEATIFRKARIITGRTAKHPAFIDQAGTPYVHLNCPALLCVKRVKDIPAGRRIERIGFSIQLPHQAGIPNQSTGGEVSKLAIEVLFALARTHAVEVIAHHKSEYFHFLHLLKDTGIPVIYSSFYQDLHEVYPRYDLVVTTRLHSSLFANGHGIPGIIINDTDRHTHTLQGFPHSVWVNSRAAFDREFARVAKLDLAAVATEMARFKTALTARYVETLKPVFAGQGLVAALESAPAGDLATRIRSALGQVPLKERVLEVMSGLTADYWLENNKEDYRKSIAASAGWFDTPTFLNWFASELKPALYLEIGVRRGRSMAQVLTRSPQTNAYGFDLWLADYGCLPEKGIITTNPGPAFVTEELRRLGVAATPTFIVGSSHDTLRPFFADQANPRQFDLMLVDGDHSDEGARKDLEIAFAHVAPGGAVVFDDTRNSAHPGLQGVWDSFKALHPGFLFIEDSHRTGTAVAFRPPFDRIATAVAGPPVEDQPKETAATYQFDSEKKEQALVRSLVKPGMTVFDVGAHIGKYTKLFSLLVGDSGQVVSFEPTPATGQKLADRITREQLSNVTLNRMAVSDRDGTVTLHQFPEEYSSWNGIGRPSMEDPRDPSKLVPFVGADEVPSTTLDSYCSHHGIDRIDYLKLDVEGAEIFALNGAENLFARQAVGCIQFEISRKMLEGLGTRARQAFEFLSRHGYECHAIGERGEIGPVATDSDSFYDNYVAFPVKAADPAAGEAPVLPIHFFTIVLNGQPFIRHHIGQFKNLPFRWHWHIVEGVADLNHDTAWSKQHGGRIPADQHRNGLSIDGTTGYLDELKREFPDNITIHRPPAGRFWDGKREMVNAPLAAVPNDSLLWQVDADELWTATQIIRARALFLAHPEKTAAFFWCHYFVGPDRVITSRDTYGNHPDFEWIRVWRFQAGDRWIAHEPPRLGRTVRGAVADVAQINPLKHRETEALGLVFQHFAYATEAQARFKKDYYGYANAVKAWRKLQKAALPCRLADHFDWVTDDATVGDAAEAGVKPLVPAEWFGTGARNTKSRLGDPERILFVRTDSIGDAVLAASMLEPIHKAHPTARIAVLCQQHIAELYVASPFVEAVLCYERSAVLTDAGQREILGDIASFKPDVILNSVRSRDEVSELLTLAHREAQHFAIESDLCNLSPASKADADRLYTRIVPALPGPVGELDQHRNLLHGLGLGNGPLQPVVWTTPADEQLAETFFAHHGLDPLTTMAVFPFTQHTIKDYPRFAEALEGLTGWNFLLLGGAEEKERLEGLVGRLNGRAINLGGMTSLRETAALIRRCRLVVGSDSCAPHIANAVGVPNVVVLGGGHFGRFFPYGNLTTVVTQPMDCYGCNWACKHAVAHCVKDVSPELVGEAIRQSLAFVAPHPRIFVAGGTCTGGASEALRRHLGGLRCELVSVEVAPPAASVPDQPLEAFLAGLEPALNAGDYVTAEAVLKAASRAYPANGDLATALANLQFQLGHFKDAIPTFKTVCELKPKDPVLPVLLAHACMNVEDAEGLESALALAFKVDAGNPHALRFVADMNWKLGRHREAAVAYGQLVQGGNSEPEVLLALGQCFRKIGDKNGAHACFTEVVRQQPAHTDAHHLLAEVEQSLHNDGAPSPVQRAQPDHEQVACPSCESRRATVVRTRADIVRCDDCKTVYLRTRMTKDAMRRLYQSYADDGSHMALPKSREEAEKSGLARDYFLKEILTFIQPGGGFLDVGCGWGAFLLNARKHGFNPRGIELTRRCVGYAKETLEIPVVDTQLEDTAIEPGSCSVVTMNHVLEHLPEPTKALARVLASLRPGGMYCGIVPNFQSACSTNEGENWYWLDPFYHYTHFTPATLRNLLEAAGFIVERIYTATGDYGAENVRKGCLKADAKLSEDDYFKAELKRYEAEGHGEEIRFFARKPAQAPEAPEICIVGGEGLDKPLVSVVVSTFNAERHIRACLEGLTRQTIFPQTEVIVVDSGSEQDERAIVEEFQRQFPNIRYIRTPRETIYAAWNRGLQAARGRYWVNANTDDSMRDDALEILVKAMDANKSEALAYVDCVWTSKPNDRFPSNSVVREVRYPDYVPIHSLFYCITGCLQFWRADELRALGGFDASYRCAGDYEIMTRLLERGGSALHVPDLLSLFYQNTGGLTQSSKCADTEFTAIMERVRQSLDIARVFRCAPGSALDQARGWTALALAAMRFDVPWEDQVFEHRDYGLSCLEKALHTCDTCPEAWQNIAYFATQDSRADVLKQRLKGRWPQASGYLRKAREGAGVIMPDVTHAVQGPRAVPGIEQEPESLRPWIARRDGRFTYLSQDLIPRPIGLIYTTRELETFGARVMDVLWKMPKFAAHFGGAGDALLLLASSFDRHPNAPIVSYPNSHGAARAFFEAFPSGGQVYLLPLSSNPQVHTLLRWIVSRLKNCITRGATPIEGYVEEWTPGLNIAKRYGIQLAPKWAAAFRDNTGSRRIAIAPKGSLAGMVGSKRNLIDPGIWPALLAHVLRAGFIPVVIGTPDEAAQYPVLDGCIEARSRSFRQQMEEIGRCAGLVGADSWAKTFSALAELPTIVFDPMKGPEMAGWADPADNVFIKPWRTITMVKDMDGFRDAFARKFSPPGIPSATPAQAAIATSQLAVSWEGSFLDLGSLSHVNRALTDLLSTDPRFSLSCVGANSIPASMRGDASWKRRSKALLAEPTGQAAVTVRHQWPPDWSRPARGALVVIQPWEFGSLPKEWVAAAKDVDEFWAPSEYVRQVYIASGIAPSKVHVVPNGIDPDLYHPQAAPRTLATAKRFKLLFVGATIGRKGPDVLLQSYLSAFTAADDVCLVIKDFGGDSVYAGQTMGALIEQARRQPNAPEILYLTDEMSPAAMPGLYTACDCLVHPYRGEGFGLPILEAMACGLPVVVTKGGAADDFVDDSNGWLIRSERRSIGNSVSNIPLVADGWLLEPDAQHLTAILRELVSQPALIRAKGDAGARIARERYTWARVAGLAAERLMEAGRATPAAAKASTRQARIVLPPCAVLGRVGNASDLLKQRKLAQAWKAACAALEERPFNPPAWELLGQIAIAVGDFKLAKACVETLRDMAPDWKHSKELTRQLKGRSGGNASGFELPATPASPRLSVCLIAKNEERFLDQCLKSVKDIAWEIIVVDTGSADRTIEIAKGHGAKVGRFTWCDDFAAARNAALDLARGDWVLVLDADEVLREGSVENLKREMADAAALAWRIPLFNIGKEDHGSCMVPRLFRNAPALFYVGRVHEQVFLSVEVRRQEWGLENKMGRTELLHYGYTEEMTRDRNKIRRNLALLEKAVTEFPDDANLIFNLGMEKGRLNRTEEGLVHYREAIRILNETPSERMVPELREICLTQFLGILKESRRYTELTETLDMPVLREGAITASMHYLAGFAFVQLGRYEEAAKHLRECLARRDERTLAPSHPDIRTVAPHHCLGVALVNLRRMEEAEASFEAAKAIAPNSAAVMLDYARFEAGRGEAAKALNLLHDVLGADPKHSLLWRFGAQILLQQPGLAEIGDQWTSEALKQFPENKELLAARGEMLLLTGNPDEATPLLEQAAKPGTPRLVAAMAICRLARAGAPAAPVTDAETTREFLAWYRRLVQWQASGVVHSLNEALPQIEVSVPQAGAVIRSVLVEAAV